MLTPINHNAKHVRLRSSAVVLHQNQLLCFKAQDPKTGTVFIFIPGGRIEEHETAPEATIRETREETGYDIGVSVETAIDRDYLFDWDGLQSHCTTIFYLGRLKSPLQNPKYLLECSYHRGVLWLPIEQIPVAFAYNEAILSAIQELALTPCQPL